MKSLIITGRHATNCEVDYPKHRLLELGAVDIAVRGKEIVLGAEGGKIKPTRDIPDLAAVSEYDLLVLPGGAKAMEYMRQDRDIIDFIATFHATGKVVASICHAGQLLISAGLCKDRDISGYYSIEDDIRNAGGRYSRGPVACDRIVSTAHYDENGGMSAWMKLVLEAVAFRELAQMRGR